MVLDAGQDGDPRNASELDEEVAAKLDGRLRRLLPLAESEVLEIAECEEAHRMEAMRRIDEIAGVLSPDASEEDRQAVARVQELYRQRWRPNVNAGALVVEPAKVRAIVEFNGNRDDLVAMDLEVDSTTHDIFTVTGTRRQLAALAAQPATRRLQLPRPLRPLLRTEAQQAQVYDVHKMVLPSGSKRLQGEDVIVGIIDTPLDVTHYAFRSPASDRATRVRYLWVQDPHVKDPRSGAIVAVKNPPGRTPHGYSKADPKKRPGFEKGLDYGRIYTEDDINAALKLNNPYGQGAKQICCPPTIKSEHGTHVAGIAAGNGAGVELSGPNQGKWKQTAEVGAAPKATIVHVSSRSNLADDKKLIESLKFIFAIADAEKKPAMVNISLGTHDGPHLGVEMLDKAVDNLLRSYQNRTVVVAAGNENAEDLPARYGHGPRQRRLPDEAGEVRRRRAFRLRLVRGRVRVRAGHRAAVFRPQRAWPRLLGNARRVYRPGESRASRGDARLADRGAQRPPERSPPGDSQEPRGL